MASDVYWPTSPSLSSTVMVALPQSTSLQWATLRSPFVSS